MNAMNVPVNAMKVPVNAMNVPVSASNLSGDPTAAWEQISKQQRVIRIQVNPPRDIPIAPNKVRFVCMSDTHSLQRHIKFPIPDGDVFIHAGDFTKCGLASEVAEFNEWLGHLPHTYKIVIAGNHELSFDPNFSGDNGMIDVNKISTLGLKREKMVQAVQDVDAKSHLTNCIYLEDSGTQIWGIKIYGTPWQPEFCKWAFNLPRGRPCLDKWKLIPTDTDVLVTHTPPVGHGDFCCSGVRAGCVDLLKEVQSRIRPSDL
ncbi:hypothetical protein B566_EDAN006193 [Ephemera danica]|nr:hypothetical protein B566_EDAN006193 [Ephemera danica]